MAVSCRKAPRPGCKCAWVLGAVQPNLLLPSRPRAVFYTVWTPFMFMMGYTDPRRPGGDRLYGEAEGGVHRACSRCTPGGRSCSGPALPASMRAQTGRRLTVAAL